MFTGRNSNKKSEAIGLPKDYQPVNVRYAQIRELLPYELLLTQDNGDGSFVYVSDVSLLFNQQRLDRMSLQALQAKFDEQVNAGNIGLSELRKHISDADLQKFIKSRYIQSLSELQQWTNYLARTESNLVESIKLEVGNQASQVVNPVAPTGSSPAAVSE